MAKRTIASIGAGTAAVIAAGWLACASSESPGEHADSQLPRIPDAQRALDPAPEQAITVAFLSEGGVLEPELVDREVTVAAVAPRPQLPSEVLSYLTGDLAVAGSLELSPTGSEPSGIPISMAPGTSLLGDEFDFPTPSLSPPAAPALD